MVVKFYRNVEERGNKMLEYTEEIIAIIGAIIALGVAISAITKTEKDDKFWAKVKSIFEKLKGKKNG
jgi:hypothetical protein